jgi:hypothetical protein
MTLLSSFPTSLLFYISHRVPGEKILFIVHFCSYLVSHQSHPSLALEKLHTITDSSVLSCIHLHVWAFYPALHLYTIPGVTDSDEKSFLDILGQETPCEPSSGHLVTTDIHEASLPWANAF